jgi:ABC-2 type transport system ATP-binding protein
MLAVEANHLTRTYRTRMGLVRRRIKVTEAVRGVSFAVGSGQVFGLLGPNGSGKTTTIKMLITLLLPTSGDARVLGLDVVHDATAVRRRIGYAFGGDRGLYLRLSALDNLRYFAELYGVPPRVSRRRIFELLEVVDLRGREGERVEAYSRGMRQRLHIARALLHDPDVIFLDEPTLGIDPVGARELRGAVASLVDQGKTVILTTHYMLEADELCDTIAVLSKGRVIAQGTPKQLKARVADGQIVEVEVFGVESRLVEDLRAIRGVRSVAHSDRGHADILRVRTAPNKNLVHEILAGLGGARVGQVTTREPTLEDAYVALVADQ